MVSAVLSPSILRAIEDTRKKLTAKKEPLIIWVQDYPANVPKQREKLSDYSDEPRRLTVRAALAQELPLPWDEETVAIARPSDLNAFLFKRMTESGFAAAHIMFWFGFKSDAAYLIRIKDYKKGD